MVRILASFSPLIVGLMAVGCTTPKWVEQTDVNFTKVGNVDSKCHENEERVRKSISPIAITNGSFKVDIEACVQKDALVAYLDSMEKFQEEILSIDSTSKRIYADQVEKLVRAKMKAVGKDRNGEDVPRAYKITLFERKSDW